MRLLLPLLSLLFANLMAAEPDAAALLRALPQVPEIVSAGGGVRWAAGDAAFPIVAVGAGDGEIALQSAVGTVRVPRRLIAERHLAVLAALPALVARAGAAHLRDGFTLQDGMLVGASLRTPEVVVVAEGVLQRQQVPPGTDQRSAEIAQVGAAVGQLLAALPASRLDALGQRTVQDVLGRLDGRDGGQAFDEVWPSVARRIVRHGWLRRWFAPELADAAVQAIARAEELRPLTAFAGDGLRIEQVQDAFGRGGWVYRTPTRVRYAQAESAPEYLGHLPELMAVVDLPAGADPASSAGQALAARLWQGGEPLASWTSGGGLVCAPARWRAAVHPGGGNLVGNAIPPHLRLADLHGDVAGLVVAGGLLRPAADGSQAEAARFISDAARLLPDAGHLDLIGEYLFTYVYPSPDAQHPELIGNKQLKSNVQQTVWQTCGNVAGGIMRGDCADIAELYHAITTAQGRHAIVIGLPEHAACAWAEPAAGGDWQVFVLQTGPPLAFSDATLPACLGKAYTSFDPTMAFDPNAVPLLLRFSGEVSRSAWSLSWRIFNDPRYAATMFEVQRDWHFQTYQRGIVAMQRLIAAGDRDNANYRELAGLAASTGQYALAAAHQRQALALTSDPVNHLTLAVEQVGRLLDAGERGAARALASDLVGQQWPALKEQLGEAAPRVAVDLAGACLNQEPGLAMPDLAVRALVATGLGKEIARLAKWLASDQFDANAWDNDTGLRSLRTLSADHALMAMAALRPEDGKAFTPAATTRELASAIQQWLDGVAFHDVEEDSAVMMRYAAAGQWYGIVHGAAEFDRLLAAAPLPDAAIDHASRQPGSAQVARDLRWIRASVPYWFGRLGDLFRRDRGTIDQAEVARLAAALREAQAATERLGLADTVAQNSAVLAQEIAALIAHDEPALRQALHRVAEQNDKELRDDAAQWLGDAARFLEPVWYARVLTAWQEVVDYKPKYFWIAWRAALAHAPQQALMAARLAAERFADDQAFVEEYGFMRTLLEPKPAHAVATPAAAAP